MKLALKIFLDKSDIAAIMPSVLPELPRITEQWLERIMSNMAQEGNFPTIPIPQPSSFYVRSLIRYKFGVVLDVFEVEQLLKEECS